MQAGLVRYADGSETLIAAGGQNSDLVFTFDLATQIWLPGPRLPHDIDLGASVPYEDSLLIVGGYNGQLECSLSPHLRSGSRNSPNGEILAGWRASR